MSRSFKKHGYIKWCGGNSDKWDRTFYSRNRRRKDKAICKECTNFPFDFLTEDDNLENIPSDKIVKNGKKYGTESLDSYAVGEYDLLRENGYMEKLRTMIDTYEVEHPDYTTYLEKDYWDREQNFSQRPTNKIMFTVKLKKGQTYVYVIDNSGMTTLGKPYYNDFYLIDQKSCLYGGQYTAAYSFDMEIKLKAKKK